MGSLDDGGLGKWTQRGIDGSGVSSLQNSSKPKPRYKTKLGDLLSQSLNSYHNFCFQNWRGPNVQTKFGRFGQWSKEFNNHTPKFLQTQVLPPHFPWARFLLGLLHQFLRRPNSTRTLHEVLQLLSTGWTAGL
jgi:hypothetical protein